MREEKGRYCPVMKEKCVKEDCAWWCEWTRIDESCAIPLLAGMFADSTVCRTVFAEVE